MRANSRPMSADGTIPNNDSEGARPGDVGISLNDKAEKPISRFGYADAGRDCYCFEAVTVVADPQIGA